jgi:hypothetical protein
MLSKDFGAITEFFRKRSAGPGDKPGAITDMNKDIQLCLHVIDIIRYARI